MVHKPGGDYEGPEGYTGEFTYLTGETRAVVDLRPDQVRPAEEGEVARATKTGGSSIDRPGRALHLYDEPRPKRWIFAGMPSGIGDDARVTHLVVEGDVHVAVDPEGGAELAHEGFAAGHEGRAGQIVRVPRVNRVPGGRVVGDDDRGAGIRIGRTLAAEPGDGGAVVAVRVTGPQLSPGTEQVNPLVVVHVGPAGRHGGSASARKEAKARPEGTPEESDVAELEGRSVQNVRPRCVLRRLRPRGDRVAFVPKGRQRCVQVAVVGFVIAGHVENRGRRKGLTDPPEGVGPPAHIACEEDEVGRGGRRRIAYPVRGRMVLQVQIAENTEAHVLANGEEGEQTVDPTSKTPRGGRRFDCDGRRRPSFGTALLRCIGGETVFTESQAFGPLRCLEMGSERAECNSVLPRAEMGASRRSICSL